jgi:nucleoside phosphorylase
MSTTLIVCALMAEASHLLRPMKLRRDPATGSPTGPITFTGPSASTSTSTSASTCASTSHRLLLIVSGMGPARARAAVLWALDLHHRPATPITRIVNFGLAGGLTLGRDVGTVIVPRTLVDLSNGRQLHQPSAIATDDVLASAPRIVGTVEEKRTLAGEGYDAVDMEAATVMGIAADRGIGWLCVRGISDGPGDMLPRWLGTLTDERGQTDGRAVAGHLLTHPWHLPMLVRIGRASQAAGSRAAERLLTILRAAEAATV